MDAYRITDSGGKSLTCKQVEYAVKKYRGHRKVPTRMLEGEEWRKYTCPVLLRTFKFTGSSFIELAVIKELRCPVLVKVRNRVRLH